MRLFLGVHGGQGSTTALIGDESGRVLGSGAGLEAACAQAGLDAATVRFEAACFGMSGGLDDKRAILAGVVRAGHLTVTSDAAIALSGATATGQGIAVIAGTGSVAFGRNAAGRTAGVGGWGYVHGDEGGGFDIARQALRAALRMEEGWGPPTSLRHALLEATGSRTANEALHLFYTAEWPRSRVAGLAPLADAAASEGDAPAMEILNGTAVQLAMLAAAVRSQLWKPGEPVEVAHIGGVFRSRAVLEHFRMLVDLEPGNRCGPPRHGRAEGALLEAYRAVGLNPELARS